MAVELSGTMHNIRDVGNGKGKRFGLRITSKDENNPEGWSSVFEDVTVWADAKGYEVVTPANEKEKVTITDAYKKVRSYKNREGETVVTSEWNCQGLHLGWGEAPSGPSSTPIEDDDEMPF